MLILNFTHPSPQTSERKSKPSPIPPLKIFEPSPSKSIRQNLSNSKLPPFALLAELHGRIGHFPSLIRLRPLAGSTPTTYEVAELLNLQTIREMAHTRR